MARTASESYVPRYLVRRAARRGWMVWGRHTKGPATFQGHLVVGLPEDHARAIKDALTKQYIGDQP